MSNTIEARRNKPFSSLDMLREYTAQFGVPAPGTDDEFPPHKPIGGDEAHELIRWWSIDSVANPASDPRHERTWDALQGIADDYELPLDEFLGAVWFVAHHNGAYTRLDAKNRIGCALGEIERVMEAFCRVNSGEERTSWVL